MILLVKKFEVFTEMTNQSFNYFGNIIYMLILFWYLNVLVFSKNIIWSQKCKDVWSHWQLPRNLRRSSGRKGCRIPNRIEERLQHFFTHCSVGFLCKSLRNLDVYVCALFLCLANIWLELFHSYEWESFCNSFCLNNC